MPMVFKMVLWKKKSAIYCYVLFFGLSIFIYREYYTLSKMKRSSNTFFSAKTKVTFPQVLKKSSLNDLYGSNHSVTKQSKTAFTSKSNTRYSKFKLILMWKDLERWWNGGTMMPKGTSGPLVNADCPVTSCLFTGDESLINQSDVVVFYAQTMKDFPITRNSQQRFVFAQLESPITHNLPVLLNDKRIRHGYFNWTMTYRWDSDIVHRGEYGYMVTKSNHTGVGIRARILNSWSVQKDNTLVLADQKKAKKLNFIENVVKKKTKLVAWFVSHCTTPIRREEYVRQLNHYVTVDIFGDCSNRECPYKCEDMLRTHYKFYLAFENSWCHDYVTEKFYKSLIYDTVPIVMGGANYSKFAPPHSYINARDFSSPNALAQYLLLLNKSDTLYAAYFEWKEYFDVLIVDNYGLCDLCRMAHDTILPSKSYPDIKKWWVDDGGCQNNTERYFL